MEIEHKECVMDALYNATYDNTTDIKMAPDQRKIDYGKGVIVGLVSGLMANGMKFDTAIQTLRRCRDNSYWYRNKQTDINEACIPESWWDEWYK